MSARGLGLSSGIGSLEGEPIGRPMRRALVVDDTDHLRESISELLHGVGYEVLQATDGAEARSLIATEPVHVVVSDISMPNLDGFALLRAVREQDLDLPVILITGFPDEVTAEKAVDHGAFRYFKKPLAPREFLAAVGKASTMYRLARIRREALADLGMQQKPVDRAGEEANLSRGLRGLKFGYHPVVDRDLSVAGHELAFFPGDGPFSDANGLLETAARLDRLSEVIDLVHAELSNRLQSAGGEETFFVDLRLSDLGATALFERHGLAAIAPRVSLAMSDRLEGSSASKADALKKMRAKGYRIALSDVGAASVGFRDMVTVEPDVVKVDRVLTHGVATSASRERMVRSIAEVAHEMGAQVMALGVTSEHDLATLRGLEVDLYQGPLISSRVH